MSVPIDPLAAHYGAERLALVGNICHQWANIEYQIACAIWSLLGVDEATGIILTGGLLMRPRVNMATKLAKHLSAPQKVIAALTEVHSALEVLEEKRNKAVHGVRFANLNDPASEYFEMHRGKKGRHLETNDSLRELAQDLANLGTRLYSELNQSGLFHLPMVKPTAAMALKTAQARSAPDSQPGS